LSFSFTRYIGAGYEKLIPFAIYAQFLAHFECVVIKTAQRLIALTGGRYYIRHGVYVLYLFQ